jgi:DNA-binding MarR family transcriptional regulator
MPVSGSFKIAVQHSGRETVDPRIDSLRLTVTRLARQLRKKSGTELTPTQMSALNVVGRHGRIRAGRLAEIEGISKPTVTRLTGRLEDMGLVERTQDDADARCSQLGLTPKGEALLVQASRRADEYLASQISVLHPGDQRRLLEALPALIRLLEIKA